MLHNVAIRLTAGCTLALLLACTQTTTVQNAPGALPSGPPTEPGPSRITAATYFAHANLLERRNNLEQAATEYVKALEIQPDFIAARTRLGITLNKLGRHEEASEQFTKAIAMQPGQAHLHNNLGFSLFLEGKYPQAEAELKKAIELQPNFARARVNCAVVLGKLGRFDAALEHLEEVCTPADAHYNLAMILTEAGEYHLAARNFQQALALNPDLESARTQLREVARLAAHAELQGARADTDRSDLAALSGAPPEVALAADADATPAPPSIAPSTPQSPETADAAPQPRPTPTSQPTQSSAVTVGPIRNYKEATP